MKQYTSQQKELLFELESQIDYRLDFIDRQFEEARRRLPYKIQKRIFSDFQKAFNENCEILDVINETQEKVTQLHASPCKSSGVEWCICGDSMGLNRNRRTQEVCL